MDRLAHPLTLAEWQEAYAQGVSPLEALLALAHRLGTASPPEAWITRTDAVGVASQVGAIEARRARFANPVEALRAMPLFGVPFAVKDNIDVLGLPTTAACRAFERPVALHATAVARLIDAGAVCLGKTNLDQFATGLVGARSPYGRPSSTFDPARISGGSSSGSAVVVSRGDVVFALGTDTAGSGRVPAGFNNVVGLKPTPGRVSSAGVLPACRSIDCISVFALTVGDAARVLEVIEGPDPLDAYSAFRAGPTHWGRTLAVGIPNRPVFGHDAGESGYPEAFARAVAQLEALGHRVVPVDFAPLHAVGDALYGGAWIAERHAVVEALMERSPEAFDPAVLRVIGRAREFSATDAFRAQYALREAQRDNAALWQHVDLLMVPTAPTHPRHAEVDADPLGVNAGLGTYTNFVNLLGWCALALPAGFTEAGLPFGVTFIAPGAADVALARFGERWEAAQALPMGATGRRLEPAPAADPALTASRTPSTSATLPIAVVGAHLGGQPLNGQLLERGATLVDTTTTAARYRLFALPGTTPPKPGMVRVGDAGAAIEVEVWDVPIATVGSFLAGVRWPLAIGAIELADGRWVHGFVCDANAVAGARDISAYGGWRAVLAAGIGPAASSSG